jgi:AraC-like DNA-binding protein
VCLPFRPLGNFYGTFRIFARFTETDVVHYPPMTDRRRHDWSVVRDHIHPRMAELRLSVVDLARASGLSEKHVRTLLNDGPEQSLPREQTRWALCDALHWTPDSIDRILDGDAPLEVDADESGDVSRLDLLDGRLSEIESVASMGLTQIRTQQAELAKFWRLLEQLQDAVRSSVADRVAAETQLESADSELRVRLAAVETALAGLRQAGRPGDVGRP